MSSSLINKYFRIDASSLSRFSNSAFCSVSLQVRFSNRFIAHGERMSPRNGDRSTRYTSTPAMRAIKICNFKEV